NLGLNGSLITYADYSMLKAYLKRFPPPKAIVLWHTLDVWQRDLDLAVFGFTLPDAADRHAALANSFHNFQWTTNSIYWPVKFVSQLAQATLYLISDAYRFQVWIKKDLAMHLPGLDPSGLVERIQAEDQPFESHIADQIRAIPSLSNTISPDSRYWLQQL